MDHQDTQQQQKDFYDTLIAEVGAERGNESHHPCMYGHGGALPSPSSSTMSPSNPAMPNVPLDLDIVTQLIGLQGQQTGSMNQGQYSPQLVLEQRLKLNQLQQLQLQNQILQQQVRGISLTFPERSPCVNSPIFVARILEWPRPLNSHRGFKRASETSKSLSWSPHTW
jgi:hypothetical protein